MNQQETRTSLAAPTARSPRSPGREETKHGWWVLEDALLGEERPSPPPVSLPSPARRSRGTVSAAQAKGGPRS